MNGTFDNFEDLIIREEKGRIIDKFELSQIKIEHFYCFDEPISGDPFSTSIELKISYDEDDNVNVTKTVNHTYASFEDSSLLTTDSYTISIKDGYILFDELSKFDLRTLKNNYYSDNSIDELTHWELTYNYLFKICGTYNNEIEEFNIISTILNFKSVIKEEINKIKNKINMD